MLRERLVLAAVGRDGAEVLALDDVQLIDVLAEFACLGMAEPNAVTTTRVAAEAGISVGSLYHYLPDRDAILRALALGHLAGFEAQMARHGRSRRRSDADDVPHRPAHRSYLDDAGLRPA